MRVDDQPTAALLSDAQRHEFAGKAIALLDGAWMLETLAASVNIASPTGEERAFAEFLVETMRQQGLRARLQPIDAHSANAIAEFGDGSGPSVMLFAPLDSAISGIEAEEVPWVGPELRPDQRPIARIEGNSVIGLSAISRPSTGRARRCSESASTSAKARWSHSSAEMAWASRPR
jgi:succinyl-diaminopimelate desuccinylase